MQTVKNKAKKEQSRLNVRLSPAIKERVQRAAHILGQDLTEFTSSTLSRHADEVIKNYGEILLSESDYEFFINELKKPAVKPSDYSRKAIEEYRRVFKT